MSIIPLTVISFRMFGIKRIELLVRLNVDKNLKHDKSSSQITGTADLNAFYRDRIH